MPRPQFTLRALLVAVLVMGAFVDVGCQENTAPPPVKIVVPPRPLEAWQERAIGLAKSHLEAMDGRPVDATFTAKREGNGYSVFVQYVTGDNGGQPIYIPGGHCTVLISDDWKVTAVLPGA